MVQARDRLGNWRIRHVSLTIAGIIAVIAGLVLPHLRPVKHSVEALVIAVGSVVALRSLITLASAETPERDHGAAPLDTYIPLILIAAFLLIAMPFLVLDTIRAGYRTPLDFNEGMNLFHTARLLHGAPLYPALARDLPVTPLYYPPLSFVMLGALDHLTGAPLFTGRAVGLLSVLGIAWLVFRIIDNLGGTKPAAALGAFFWLALMTRYSENYVGMYDPQFLGQAFSVGAAYLYSKWLDHLTFLRSAALALLCCLALFIKFLFIPVPLALALAILLRDRKRAANFALMGVVIFSSLMLGAWIVWGTEMFRNLSVELARQPSSHRILDSFLTMFFTPFGFVLLEASIVLFLVHRAGTRFALLYLLTSTVWGSYAVGRQSTGVNVWFDVFISAAIAVGLFAAEVARLKVGWARGVLYVILACTVLPVVTNLKADLGWAFDYGALRRDEQAYVRDVDVLRSLPGPALVETPTVLAFDAGKALVFDPFFGYQLMLAGRLPESMLTDRIQQRFFGVIVLSFDLHELLADLRNSRALPRASWTTVSRTTWTWLTDNTMLSIEENYEPLNPRTPHPHIHSLRECQFFYCPEYLFFYVPRKSGV